jgi:hypothetical protein
MRSLDMSGAHVLTDDAVESAVTERAPGNFALGYRVGGAFKVFYVGRSDSDLRRRLREWVDVPSRFDRYDGASRAAWALRGGSTRSRSQRNPALGSALAADSRYTHFAFSYAASAAAAFAKESRNFADFGGCVHLDNGAHPAREIA